MVAGAVKKKKKQKNLEAKDSAAKRDQSSAVDRKA